MSTSNKRIARLAPISVVVVLALLVPTFMAASTVSLVTKILIFGLFVMALDLAFGYTGLWSFSHAAFFGVAAYTTAILITRFGITSFWLTVPAGIGIAAVTAALFAWVSLRMRGVYFLLITLALGELIYTVCQKWEGLTGGTDGIFNVPYPKIGFGIEFNTTRFYYLVCVIVAICTLVLYLIVKSPFGVALQGIRDNETRMRTLGYNTWLHKFVAFTVSGAFAGMAGILYVHYNGIIVPESVDMVASGFATIILIIGGTGTLWGGLLGSAIVYLLSYFVSQVTPARWPLILGCCFVAAVMLARGGVYPQLVKLCRKLLDRLTRPQRREAEKSAP